MKIILNEDAEKHFNEKVLDYLYELKPDKKREQQAVKVESSSSHVFVSEHLTDKNIAGITALGYVDQLSGRQVARYFLADNIPIGLSEEKYEQFERFIENIHRKKEINSFLSHTFLCDCAFEWFEKRYKGLFNKEIDLVTFIKEKGEESIRQYTVSIPISFLSIEKPFKIGMVSFDYLTKDFCDSYINAVGLKANEQGKINQNQLGVFEAKFRKRYQGTVFASVTLEAEQQRCVEIAKLQTQKALTVLRYFSPSSFIPEMPCYFGIMGKTHIPESYYFIFKKEGLPSIQEGIEERRMHTWPISDNELSHLHELGLGLAANIMFKVDPTELEDLILNSIYLFGRTLTSMEFQDKIVYALVSIETLLLQNQTEPIQSNVGLKLAFLTESEAIKRKSVREMINKAYKFRSSYIHHGKIKEDWELLKVLQHSVWTAIRNALVSTAKYKSVKDFLNHIDHMIMS